MVGGLPTCFCFYLFPLHFPYALVISSRQLSINRQNTPLIWWEMKRIFLYIWAPSRDDTMPVNQFLV
jgi:hypothetical protein